ncbi:hypothetical protein ACFVHQ_04605 [Actinomycetes bacterium NPDC127524]
MNVRSVFLLLFVFVLIGVVAGCEKDKPAESKQLKSVEHKQLTERRKVKQIIIHEAPENSPSPSNALLHQYEVDFEDGVKKFPDANSIISEVIFNKKSIVTIHSPKGKNEYAVFLYSLEDNWGIDGILEFGVYKENTVTDKEGLALPMDKFSATDLSAEELGLKNNKANIWAFADKENIITITRFDSFPFDERYKTKTINLKNGSKAYISKDSFKNKLLYYFDSEKLIVLSGNADEEKLINLANSLPPSDSYGFPAAKK